MPHSAPNDSDHVARRDRVRAPGPLVRRLGRRRASLALGCLGIGLLLWARLILISDMPRMALAEPEDAMPSPAEASAEAAPEQDDDARAADGETGGAGTTGGGAAAPQDQADRAHHGQNFPDPHNPDSFTPEPPKSQRNQSD